MQNFTPEVADVKTFLELYGILVEALVDGRIPKNVCFSLLSKMNLKPHVAKFNPGQGEALIKCIFRGLTFLSKELNSNLFEVKYLFSFEKVIKFLRRAIVGIW